MLLPGLKTASHSPTFVFSILSISSTISYSPGCSDMRRGTESERAAGAALELEAAWAAAAAAGGSDIGDGSIDDEEADIVTDGCWRVLGWPVAALPACVVMEGTAGGV